MNPIGVIFDFNGTMFFDSDKHEKAWKSYIEELCNKEISEEELENYIHGRTSSVILEHFLGDSLPSETIYQLSQEKELVYRMLCMKDKDNLKLAPGLEDFLSYLSKSNIPMTIATATNWDNVDFYFDVFDLYRWFDINQVVYDNGTLRSKPEPDVYLQAAKAIDVAPENCIVFEDALTGIKAAINAGVRNVVVVTGDSTPDIIGIDKIVAVIKDYTMLDEDLTIFN